MVQGIGYGDGQIEHPFLTGKLLIAMPFRGGPGFRQSVIYVCGHDETGSMGIMINKPLETVEFSDLLEHLGINHSKKLTPALPVYYGGPVDIGRGFVLHTPDYLSESSAIIEGDFVLTATLDVLRALSHNRGPTHTLVAMGYVGWATGQLEQEIINNDWLVMEASPDLVFHPDYEGKWRSAMQSIGIEPNHIVLDFGHA
jgi:putative transcriptional regulator